jgi:hypothetical protein
MTPAHPAASSPALVAREALLVLCRRGIEGCRARDRQQVGRVFMELIGMLNFSYREAATRLFEVYDDGLRHVRRWQFDVPRTILERLEAELRPCPRRQGWAQGRDAEGAQGDRT